ncbi:hypothetical protein [Lysobacter gummosus]
MRRIGAKRAARRDHDPVSNKTGRHGAIVAASVLQPETVQTLAGAIGV